MTKKPAALLLHFLSQRSRARRSICTYWRKSGGYLDLSPEGKGRRVKMSHLTFFSAATAFS